jgi:hypothetical protein
VADADSKPEPAARKLVEGRRHLRHCRRVPRVDRQHRRAQSDPFRRRRIRRQDDGSVTFVRQLVDPHRVEPQSLRELRALDGLVDRLAGGDGCRQPHRGRDLPVAECSSAAFQVLTQEGFSGSGSHM